MGGLGTWEGEGRDLEGGGVGGGGSEGVGDLGGWARVSDCSFESVATYTTRLLPLTIKLRYTPLICLSSPSGSSAPPHLVYSPSPTSLNAPPLTIKLRYSRM